MPEFDHDASDHSAMERDVVALNAQIGGVIQVGRVVASLLTDPTLPTDPINPQDIPRVLVQVGAESTDAHTRNWMPWAAARAMTGADGEWWQPEVDEQVVVLVPSGDLVKGIIIGSLYRNKSAAIVGIKPYIHRRSYEDGTQISYDKKLHKLSIDGKAQAEALSSLRLSAIMDPIGAPKGTSTLALELGNTLAPDVSITADSSSGHGGELKVVSTLKTTLIAGTEQAAKIKVLADASVLGNEKMVISAGTTEVAINKDGNVEINAGQTAVTISQAGNVEIGAANINLTATESLKLQGGANSLTINNSGVEIT
ncbi:hypothetical protein AB835_12825 [Candidatus Endobugula sertula]|uniref:Gp5/Type VI secretion system Vgr protein OB-fold domain-containing protein n=1 Tax=Candidatus Endobugula sertula TaxID=62101 RepID=A0A1D2QM78_9GAMM|nr:hypothetical protein AB835_12825 [Candidatus Endobugula sertula]